MKLEFKYGGVEYSAGSILEFTKEEMSDFWSEPFFHFYPDVDRAFYKSLNDGQRKVFLVAYFTAFEAKNRELLQEKTEAYNAHWNKYAPQIIQALEDAFEIDLTELFNDMVCLITFNSISPRYLESHTFDTFYLQSERGALGNAIHEIIHFVWFHVWQQHFRDDPAEYETPHLKWILSEMVVDPIMRDPRLFSINPYCAHGGCVYPYFYTMMIDGKPILDTLYELFQTLPIHGFMEASYRYCIDHEAEIRKHIEESENP